MENKYKICNMLILCKDKYQLKLLGRFFKKLDIKFRTESVFYPNRTNWLEYKENTFYTLNKEGRLRYGNIYCQKNINVVQEFKKKGYDVCINTNEFIIRATKFIKIHN